MMRNVHSAKCIEVLLDTMKDALVLHSVIQSIARLGFEAVLLFLMVEPHYEQLLYQWYLIRTDQLIISSEVKDVCNEIMGYI